MIIFLYGEDSFRSRQKIKEIISQYKERHKSGLDLVVFREDQLDWLRFIERIESVSMFGEKKLIILENCFSFLDPDQTIDYLKKNKLDQDKETVIVFWQEENPDKRGKLYKQLTKKPVMSQEFIFLKGAFLENWLKKEIESSGGKIDLLALKKLAWQVGSDLWQMSAEINKLICFAGPDKLISEKDVDLLVKPKINLNIFETIDALGQQNRKKALKLLHQHLDQGENEIYLFTMLTYQLRNMIKIKSLLDKGVAYYSLAKEAVLHPFVIKKTSDQVRNFSLERLKEIYKKLLVIEIDIKTGKIDPRLALDLFIAEI